MDVNAAGLVTMLTPVQRLVGLVPASEQPPEILVRLREEASWKPGVRQAEKDVQQEQELGGEGEGVLRGEAEVHPVPGELGEGGDVMEVLAEVHPIPVLPDDGKGEVVVELEVHPPPLPQRKVRRGQASRQAAGHASQAGSLRLGRSEVPEVVRVLEDAEEVQVLEEVIERAV